MKVWREVDQLVVVAAMGRGGEVGEGEHPGVQGEGEGRLLFQGVDLCDLSCYTESP